MKRSKLAKPMRAGILVLIPLLAVQCATTTSGTDGVDEKIAQGVAEGWTQHLLAHDVTAAMTLVDPSFTSEAFPKYTDLLAYLETAAERDYFSGATSDFTATQTQVKDKKAQVAPVKLHTQVGTFIIGFELTRNGQGWMVAGLDWEMY